VRLPASSDSRLLLAGIVAALALVAYLAVAFANTHASNGPTANESSKLVPWVAADSKLVPHPFGKHAYAVRVTPLTPAKPGTYGALVPTLLPSPPSGRRFVVGLWLKGAGLGRVGVSVDEFSPGASSVYVIQTAVPVTRRWQHFTFEGRVKGSWLGLGMYVYRPTGVGRRTWFAVRGLTVNLHSG
jgi:hypothetical protein